MGTIPDGGFVSSGGGLIGKEEGDLLVRAVSGGDFHATIPGPFSLSFLSLYKFKS